MKFIPIKTRFVNWKVRFLVTSLDSECQFKKADYFKGFATLINIVEHEGRNCAIPGRFKIFPLLRLNFSLRENSKHITSVNIAIAERGNRSGYPERSGK